MKFSEALEQYLEARETIARLENEPGDYAWHRRDLARQDMRDAVEVMDRLAPGDA